MISETNHKIKVFSQLYVGFKAQDKGEVDLGFATPYEDNAAFRKRQATVDSWSTGYNYGRQNKKPVTKILDNVPRSGFKITDNVKRVYWGGGNVVFRVFDPYGFELEIPSQNLMALLQCCGIQPGGVVPGNCIWGRDGSTNVLLQETSEEYKSALFAAESLKKPKSAERVIGTQYVLQNGNIATFLGKFWVTHWSYAKSGGDQGVTLRLGDKTQPGRVDTKQVYEPVQYDAVLDVESDSVTFYKKAPLVAVHQADSMTPEKAEKIANAAENKQYASGNEYGNNIDLITIKKPNNIVFGVEPLTRKEFQMQMKQFSSDVDRYRDGGSSEEKTASNYGIFRLNLGIAGLKYNGRLFAGEFNFHTEVESIPPETRSWSLFNQRKVAFELSACLGSLEINGKYLHLCYGDHNYGWNYSDRHRYGTTSSYTVDVFRLPTYRTKEDVKTWVEAQYEAGNIFKVVIKEAA